MCRLPVRRRWPLGGVTLFFIKGGDLMFEEYIDRKYKKV